LRIAWEINTSNPAEKIKDAPAGVSEKPVRDRMLCPEVIRPANTTTVIAADATLKPSTISPIMTRTIIHKESRRDTEQVLLMMIRE
jgi:hypothetical protein